MRNFSNHLTFPPFFQVTFIVYVISSSVSSYYSKKFNEIDFAIILLLAATFIVGLVAARRRSVWIAVAVRFARASHAARPPRVPFVARSRSLASDALQSCFQLALTLRGID